MSIMCSDKLFRKLSLILFIVYFGLLVWIISFKCNSYDAIEGSYFLFRNKSISERINYIVSNSCTSCVFSNNTFIDDISNVLIFIPFGFYIMHFMKNKNILKLLAISFLVSLTFEIIQLFLLIGTFSFNDLITNTLGGVLGYFVYLVFHKTKHIKFFMFLYNAITIILIITFTPILVYAVINTVNNIGMYKDVIFRVDIFN